MADSQGFESQLDQLKLKGDEHSTSGEPGSLTFTWRKGPNAPSKMFSGTCTAHGKKAYFSGWQSSEVVHEFDAETDEWVKLTDCPHTGFALAVVDGLLTAVGGDDSMWYKTNKLLSYKNNKWVQYFPSMPTKRTSPAVACNGSILVVIGGYEENQKPGTLNKRLETVEIMDIKTRKWFTAAPLPYGITDGTASIDEDTLYVMGGHTTSYSYDKIVSVCSLQALLQSTTQKSSTKVWQKTEQLPVDSACCVTVKGQLLAVGGVHFNFDEMTPIRKYNSVCNSWDIVSHMTIGRSQCLATVLSGDQLMVVGGFINRRGNKTDEVEIASIV